MSSTSAAHICRADISPWDSATTGSKSAGQLSGLVDRLVHQPHDFRRVVGLCIVFLRQLRLMHLGHKRNPGQVLAEAVMQVLPNSPLLARADLQQCFLQVLPLGDVDPRGDDVIGGLAIARQQGARPGDQAAGLHAW